MEAKEDEHMIPIDELQVPKRLKKVTKIDNILDNVISAFLNIALKQNFGIQLIAGTIESVHQPFCDVWESLL